MKIVRTPMVLKGRFHQGVRLIVAFLIFLLLSAYVPISSSQQMNQDLQPLNFTDGQFLYSPIWSTTTYLRNANGSLIHFWESSYLPGVAVWWLGDGTILRTIRVDVGYGGGAGGGVQKVEWDGTVSWDFRYNTDGALSHHDVKILPNGNVLLIAWETKTRDEAIAAGRDPASFVGDIFVPDHVIEVQPTGPTSGDIIWEWHVWDHLIQDFDSNKENYGIVADHPELVDINYGANPLILDWMHTNSIDYNEKYDQILLSICNFNELWVIDHNTTTEEAAGHSGGKYGKGGDVLYRWGNPEAYRAGASDDQKLFGQHDATWIKSGLPGEGHILVFNNGGGNPGKYSTVDEIIPPINDYGDYYFVPGSAYGPEGQTWMYVADPPMSLFADRFSGAWRLPNGNTIITNGVTGLVFEVTPEKETVWQYNTGQEVFKIVYIPSEEPEPPHNTTIPDLACTGSLSWTDIKPGATVVGSFQLQNIGDTGSLLNWTINTSLLTWGTWSFHPESGINLTPEDGQITVQVSVIAPEEPKSKFETYLRVENIDNRTDFDLIPVTLKTPVQLIPHWLMLLQHWWSYFLHHHLFVQKFWDSL